MSIATKKSLEALVRLAHHADEGGACSDIEFLRLAVPYIHDLLVQQNVHEHSLSVRQGREVHAHARVTEVLEIIQRIVRECGILRKDLAHLRAELVIEEPTPPLSRLRAEKQAGLISAPGPGRVTKI